MGNLHFWNTLKGDLPQFWYLVSDGISEDNFLWILLRWYLALVISISHLDSFKTAWQLSYLMIPHTTHQVVHTYKLLNYIFVFYGIMHYTAIQVFLWPCKFIISCFYQPINFLDNFRHLTEHPTYTLLLVCIILSWQVTIPRTGSISSVFGLSQNEIIHQFGVTWINWRDTQESYENCEQKSRYLFVYIWILCCKIFK